MDEALEEVRRIALHKMVLDYDWHERGILDPFAVENEIHSLGRRILDLIGPPKGIVVHRIGLEREGWDIPPEAA